MGKCLKEMLSSLAGRNDFQLLSSIIRAMLGKVKTRTKLLNPAPSSQA